ncbi:MAG TPA: PKD domain-containing protein [Candidatus Thermoplasmatota archaeon]|nr:PKD domain-containing protein [Candidatus Thermoplasmatota archaeon]
MRHPGVFAAIVLLALPGLMPPASADWEAVHAFPSSAERSIIDFAYDARGALHTLSWHRNAFLVYDTNASGNWTATFIREREGIVSVALGRIGGSWGALYSVPPMIGGAVVKDGGSTWFATAEPNGTAAKRVVAPYRPWNTWRTMPDGLLTLHIDGVRWNFTLHGASGVTVWTTWPRLDRTPTGLTLLADGRGFGVTYNRTGGYAIHVANVTIPNATLATKVQLGHAADPRVTRTLLDRFWDYRGANAAVAPNGTAFAWFSRGAKACDTFWGAPAGPFRRVTIDPCPIDDDVPWDFVFLGPKPLAILSNRIMVVGERPAPLECVQGFRTPRIVPNGDTYLVGGASAIYRDRGSPRINFTTFPTAGYTGFSVRFAADLEGNDTRPGLNVRWDFGDEGQGATGWAVNRTYYKPGNYTVRAVAKWEGCGAHPIERVGRLLIEGPAMEAPKSTPTRLAPEADFGEDLQDSAASRLPGPGLVALAGVALAAARVARRR